MIVYNVKRKWFAEKAAAAKYRVAEGLPPAALSKITVEHRDNLAALLNMLCEPATAYVPPSLKDMVDHAYVPVETDVPDCVPRFLLDAAGQKEWDRRHLK